MISCAFSTIQLEDASENSFMTVWGCPPNAIPPWKKALVRPQWWTLERGCTSTVGAFIIPRWGGLQQTQAGRGIECVCWWRRGDSKSLCALCPLDWKHEFLWTWNFAEEFRKVFRSSPEISLRRFSPTWLRSPKTVLQILLQTKTERSYSAAYQGPSFLLGYLLVTTRTYYIFSRGSL